MNRKLKDEDMDILFRGILKLKTVEDCYDFFEDLCTIAELRAMVATLSGGPYAGRRPDLQRYRAGNRRIDRDDQPGQ